MTADQRCPSVMPGVGIRCQQPRNHKAKHPREKHVAAAGGANWEW